MIAGKQLLTLTSKGREELDTRVHKLDAMSRNILFLIDKGNNTLDALQQRSLFPPETLLARVPQLISDGFLSATTAADSATAGPRASNQFQLLPNVSLSQARFELCDFCLDHFGTRSQSLVASINRCSELAPLQQVLDRMQADVRQSLPEQLPALIACVATINESAL